MEHSRILLHGNDRAAVIHADARDPDDLLGQPEIREQLDFSQPIGLLTLCLWHFVSDVDDPPGLMARYVARLVPDSYVALTHITRDGVSSDTIEEMDKTIDHTNQNTADTVFARELEQVTNLFAGTELVAPGVVGCPAWRPEGPGDFSDDPNSNMLVHAGVGRVP